MLFRSDLRSIKPWDRETVMQSARKTGCVIVADPGWRTAGAAAEIAAEIGEQAFQELRAPVVRVTLPDAPAPTTQAEEERYYPGAKEIATAARALLEPRGQRRAAKVMRGTA